MGVRLHALVPGVQEGNDAGPAAHVAVFCEEADDARRGRPQEQVTNEFAVQAPKDPQLGRQREDELMVVCFEEMLALMANALFNASGCARSAESVPAAVGAILDLVTEGRFAAAVDGVAEGASAARSQEYGGVGNMKGQTPLGDDGSEAVLEYRLDDWSPHPGC
jgi:hypothetical protein